MQGQFEIFVTAPPGLEEALAEDMRAARFAIRAVIPSGVSATGGWRDVARANLELRGATKVLVRVARFRAMSLAQLAAGVAAVDWTAFLAPGGAVRAEASLERSKLFHRGQAARAVTDALGRAGYRTAEEGQAALGLKLRVEDNVATLSLDTSGEPLHRRGRKPWIGKAPLRETMAALFLAQCGYRGTEPLVDPMCGSGTFLLEAAEIALGSQPGRDRSFAFETFPCVPDGTATALRRPAGGGVLPTILGFDRDQGAVEGARSNLARAGLSGQPGIAVACQPVSALTRPPGPPGLVIVNPPYGARIGEAARLGALYATLGRVLGANFAGWRVGLVTSEPGLARATGLPLAEPAASVPHGPLRVGLWRSGPLPG